VSVSLTGLTLPGRVSGLLFVELRNG
jgi:hypothetical protein